MGFGEILLILIVALIIFGPGKIPEIAQTLGKTVRAFRKATPDLTTAVTKELSTEEKTARLSRKPTAVLKPRNLQMQIQRNPRMKGPLAREICEMLVMK